MVDGGCALRMYSGLGSVSTISGKWGAHCVTIWVYIAARRGTHNGQGGSGPIPTKSTDPPRAPPASNSLAQLESCDRQARGIGALDGRLVLCGGSIVFNVRRLEECRLNAVAQVSKDGEVRMARRRISQNSQSRK